MPGFRLLLETRAFLPLLSLIWLAATRPAAAQILPPAPITVTTLAGMAKQAGSTDGTGAAARFKRPMGIAVAPDGVVYVADVENHTIRRITPSGVVTTFAGAAGTKGSTDGPGLAARFSSPIALAFDTQGTLYVLDAGNQTIRKITPDGMVTTLAGQAGVKGSTDGVGAEARFYNPQGIAVHADGTIYVADTENHSIRRVTATGMVTTLAGTAGQRGDLDGKFTMARFYHPGGLTLDSQGTLYIVDIGNHTIRKVSAAGEVTTIAGTAGKPGSTDGMGQLARFYWPNSIVADSLNRLYVTDNVNCTIRCITPDGNVTTLAGTAHNVGSQDGIGTLASFKYPLGIAIDATTQRLYITDTRNQLIRCLH